MLQAYIGSELDQRQFNGRSTPRFRFWLFSRWIDSDSAIISGAYRQTPVDLTKYISGAQLTLSGERDASSLSCRVTIVDGITPSLFYNALLVLKEGMAEIPEEDWPTTFTGITLGQPQASEPVADTPLAPASALTQRGSSRDINVTFAGRDAAYKSTRITTPGVWLPMGANKNPDPDQAFRDNYDDVGSITAEIATASWGMGLSPSECLIGTLPYRIEKQLQVVSENVLEALARLLEPLHLVPYFNGAGQLAAYSLDTNKPIQRSYPRARLVSVGQGQANHTPVNAVRMVGLASQAEDVVYADQRLGEFHGTFGYFDPEIVFKGVWGSDETKSFRVKLGSVTDGNGVLVGSPRIVDFEQEGFILEPVYPPEFRKLTEYEYEIVVRNDVFLVAVAIGLFLGGYFALSLLTTILPEISTPAGDVPNPGAIAAELASAALLIAGIAVLQQIGNFRFEVWGVPFEVVYRELPAEAGLVHFASFDTVGAGAIREYERNAAEFENHIMSSLLDVETDDGTINKGIHTWARERLAFEVARSAPRTVNMPRDILLEPGDAIEVAGMVLHVESITRTIERGVDMQQTLTGTQIRRA